jgi:DnaK suppressor protein
MNAKVPGLDPDFIAKQREDLARLRAALLSVVQDAEAEEADVRFAGAGEPREYEEDAQRYTTLDQDDNLVARDVERLRRVNRAFEKIDEGSYGLSDLSGKPIPRERLEAVPEAIFTLDEEKAIEQKR